MSKHNRAVPLPQIPLKKRNQEKVLQAGEGGTGGGCGAAAVRVLGLKEWGGLEGCTKKNQNAGGLR